MADAQVPCAAALAEVGEGSVDEVAVQKTAKNFPGSGLVFVGACGALI